MSAEGPPRRRRITAFRIGLLVGFVPVIALALGLKLSLGPELWEPRFNVEIVVNGADVTRHGGTRIVVADDRGWRLEQVCRGPCDDLQLQTSSGDNSFQVSVLNAAGQQIAADGGMYVTSGYGTNVTRWTVAGEDQLRVRISWLNRQADGSFTERPFVPRAVPLALPQ